MLKLQTPIFRLTASKKNRLEYDTVWALFLSFVYTILQDIFDTFLYSQNHFQTILQKDKLTKTAFISATIRIHFLLQLIHLLHGAQLVAPLNIANFPTFVDTATIAGRITSQEESYCSFIQSSKCLLELNHQIPAWNTGGKQRKGQTTTTTKTMHSCCNYHIYSIIIIITIGTVRSAKYWQGVETDELLVDWLPTVSEGREILPPHSFEMQHAASFLGYMASSICGIHAPECAVC